MGKRKRKHPRILTTAVLDGEQMGKKTENARIPTTVIQDREQMGKRKRKCSRSGHGRSK